MSSPDDPSRDSELLPITEVERQTGIRQATLRMWERRYGFPQPLRNHHGERVYPAEQVARLHAVRRMIDQGLRPGKIFSGAVALEPPRPSSSGACAVPEQYRRIFVLLREYRLPELHALFQHRLLDLGLRRFVIEFLAPLSVEVGLAWDRGELPVRCEHLYAEAAGAILHSKQAAVRTVGNGPPKVVLATLTGEAHALGIMMVEAVMTALEMDCIQLGAGTPPLEVAAACRETGADIVALSFSAYFPRRSVLHMATALREALPLSTTLWIGGDGVRGVGALASGITTFDSLDAIAPALALWRMQADAGRPPSSG